MPLGAAVLAAGSSRRFGDEDKLSACFRGRLLGEHVCAAIPTALFEHLWVIAERSDHPCAVSWQADGFGVQVNPRADEGMGTSVALAARLAREAGCDGLLVALADMPLVPSRHFAALVQRLGELGRAGIVTSQCRGARLPPAGFGAGHLPALEALTGDAGARALLARGEVIRCPPEWLADIDTPEALARFS